jgi:7,8-dihydropterin-6-yl-methyl-4-(beta-D-ribofuranosyl)aminobenzene 5'-phosphate synthase
MMTKLTRHWILGAFFAFAPITLLGIAASSWTYAADVPTTEKPSNTGTASKLGNVGETRTLEVLPLVDWNTASPNLRGEAGVSYLVRTDKSTILFDVGGNLENGDPSPLVANMRQLGIRLADIDAIVISHNHTDHVGGQSFARSRTFSLGPEQIDLRGKRVFVPTSMTYPGIEPVVVSEPTVIAPGVATTGTIAGKLYIGPIDEQALVIRVQGKGIVLIVGCGHQGLSNLLARSAQLFNEPIYGIIGGLHYPVPRGRWTMGGVDVQRWASYGFDSGPTVDDVQHEIDTLAEKGPQWVSLSAHDSSDEMIEAFRKKFGAQYHDLRVGEVQAIAGTKP